MLLGAVLVKRELESSQRVFEFKIFKLSSCVIFVITLRDPFLPNMATRLVFVVKVNEFTGVT